MVAPQRKGNVQSSMFKLSLFSFHKWILSSVVYKTLQLNSSSMWKYNWNKIIEKSCSYDFPPLLRIKPGNFEENGHIHSFILLHHFVLFIFHNKALWNRKDVIIFHWLKDAGLWPKFILQPNSLDIHVPSEISRKRGLRRPHTKNFYVLNP